MFVPTLLLVACAAPPPAPPEATDGHPPRRTLSPDGQTEALVDEAGVLRLRPKGQPAAAVTIDEGVDGRVGFSPDAHTLVYARESVLVETDLWALDLATHTRTQLTDWPGSEDRPVVSPDGTRVAFVGGALASWWVLDLATHTPTQLTNLGLVPTFGAEPGGFVPVPDGHVYRWEGHTLSWVARKQRWSVEVP